MQEQDRLFTALYPVRGEVAVPGELRDLFNDGSN